MLSLVCSYLRNLKCVGLRINGNAENSLSLHGIHLTIATELFPMYNYVQIHGGSARCGHTIISVVKLSVSY